MFGLWIYVKFLLSFQIFHIHKKVIVRFSPIFACKFVCLIGTWCRKRFFKKFWNSKDLWHIWTLKIDEFSVNSQIFHLHSEVIVWFSLNLTWEFFYLIGTWCCRLFKKFVLWKLHGIFGLGKIAVISSRWKQTHLYSKVIVWFGPNFACKFVHLVSMWYRQRFWDFRFQLYFWT